jgi:hypothetical protein
LYFCNESVKWQGQVGLAQMQGAYGLWSGARFGSNLHSDWQHICGDLAANKRRHLRLVWQHICILIGSICTATSTICISIGSICAAMGNLHRVGSNLTIQAAPYLRPNSTNAIYEPDTLPWRNRNHREVGQRA